MLLAFIVRIDFCADKVDIVLRLERLIRAINHDAETLPPMPEHVITRDLH